MGVDFHIDAVADVEISDHQALRTLPRGPGGLPQLGCESVGDAAYQIPRCPACHDHWTA